MIFHQIRTQMKNLIAIALVCIVLTACSSDDPIAPTEPTGPRRPGIGSTFTYEGSQLDAAGNKKPGTDFEALHSVIDSNLTILGKSGVWALRVTGPTGADTIYQCLDANKDLLQYTEFGDGAGPSVWVRFPITTTADSRDSLSETQDFNGFPLQVTYLLNVKKLGEVTATVGTESIKAVSMALSVTIKGTILGQEVVNATINQSAQYAPSIGAFVLNAANEQTLTANNVIDGFSQKLKAYSLK